MYSEYSEVTSEYEWDVQCCGDTKAEQAEGDGIVVSLRVDTILTTKMC